MILAATQVESAASLVRASVADLGAKGARHQFWLFTGEDQRREIERELAEQGVQVLLHSAFKPLISCVLEQRGRIDAWAAPASGPLNFQVEYPVHAAAVQNRFRLEAYPFYPLVQYWWPASKVHWVGKVVEQEADVRYRVSVTRQQPSTTQESAPVASAEVVSLPGALQFEVFAPNRLFELPGRQALTPCGWWLATAADGTVLRNQPWRTDYEAMYQLAVDSVAGQNYKGKGPHFGRLQIEVQHNGIQQRLPIGHDRLDTAEALHEELYFSLLERFASVADLPGGSRKLQPGQIVPVVRNVAGGANSVSVSVTPPSVSSQGSASLLIAGGKVLSATDLATAGTALAAADVEATVMALPGERYQAATPQGRQVLGLLRRGKLPPVVVNGGQHANENSGVIGALRTAYELFGNPDATVGLVALENPDGYALHRELCQVHPEHMHHAARYSALGDDLEYRSDDEPLESLVRRQLLEASGAQLFINLHGYPAHEWVRPLTGYLPHGFEWWAVPQGFLLIARYQPGYAALAEKLLRQVAAGLQAQLPQLVAYNREQLATYEAHAGKLLFPLEGAVPLVLSEARHPGPAVQMITEFPDETVHGDDLRLAHETQYRAAVLAARLWWQLSLRLSP